VVTASVDAVAFLRPARKGSVAIVAAMVNRVFRSSAEVGVRVEEEVLATGERRHCCSAYLTFVSVGRAGVAPVAVMPPVAPADSAQAEVFAAAERRRAERLAARQRARENPEELPPRLQPVTHRGGMPTLAPPLLVVGQRNAAAAAAAMAASSSLYSSSSSSLPPPPPQPQRIPPAATLSHMTQLILPQHANSLGITFGGVVLNWVEQCAHIAGARAGRCLGSSGTKNTKKSSSSWGSSGGGDNENSSSELSFTTSRVLTAGMDSVAFGAPTRVGDVLYVSAQVTAVWGKEGEESRVFALKKAFFVDLFEKRDEQKKRKKTSPSSLTLSLFLLLLFSPPQTPNPPPLRRLHGGHGLGLRRDAQPRGPCLRVRRRLCHGRRRRRLWRQTRGLFFLFQPDLSGEGSGTNCLHPGCGARHPCGPFLARRQEGSGRGGEEAGAAADADRAAGAREEEAEPRRQADDELGCAGRGAEQGRDLDSRSKVVIVY